MSQRLVLFLLVHEMVHILVGFLDGSHVCDEFRPYLKVARLAIFDLHLNPLYFPNVILILDVHMRR